MKILWTPTERQAEALRSTSFETLYGGARGGGKTDAGLAWLLYDKEEPLLRGLVLRKNAVDLGDWIARAKTFFRPFGVKTTGKNNTTEFVFPSGYTIVTGHLKDENAYEKYQGHEYQRVLIEELTHIPSEKLYNSLISSCRSTIQNIRAMVFCTTNPGNAGHAWVKKRFVDPAPAGEEFINPKTGRTCRFIPATVEDNPHLMTKDPDYVKYLDSLPDTQRKQWRHGSWEDVELEGAYYAKLLTKDRITRVPIETSLQVHTYWDLGVGDSTAIWFMQKYGKELRIINYYEHNGEGLPHYINYLHEFRAKHGFIYGKHTAPHDIQVRELTTGKSRLETASTLGIDFEIAPNLSIDDGIEAVRHTIPLCYFDEERCEQGIEALRNYRKEFDDKKQVWKSYPLHDWCSHGADSFRYLAISHEKEQPQLQLNINSSRGWMG